MSDSSVTQFVNGASTPNSNGHNPPDTAEQLATHQSTAELSFLSALSQLAIESGQRHIRKAGLQPLMMRDDRYAEFVRRYLELDPVRPEADDLLAISGIAADLGMLSELKKARERYESAFDFPAFARLVVEDYQLRAAYAQISNSGTAFLNRDLARIRLMAESVLAVTETKATTAPRFTLHTAEDAAAPVEPNEWLVTGMIEAGGVYPFVGDAGSAKTFLLIDLAITYAAGFRHWGDQRLDNHGPVLIVDEESGDKRLRRRLQAAAKGHGVDLSELPINYITMQGLDMRNPEDVTDLGKLIDATGAHLIVIDAFMDVVPGADENSVKDMIPALLALSRLAKAKNVAILPIHHTNKAGGYRGSSAIKGSVDGMFLVEKNVNSNVVEVTTEKARDIKGVQFTMIGHWQTVPDAKELESVYFSAADTKEKPPALSKSERYALRYMGDHPDSDMTTIKNNADVCTAEAARRAVYSLVEKSYAARTDSGGAGEKGIYNLTEKGELLWATL